MMPFSSVVGLDASSVDDVNKWIPKFTSTRGSGVVLPNSGSNSGELCGNFINGQPSPDLAGENRTQSRQERIKKMRALYVSRKKVPHGGNNREPITTEEAFVRHCSEEWVQQLCEQPGPCGYVYYDAAHIYRLKPSISPFHELAEHAVNKYNSEQNENLEVKKVSKANWKTMFFYMTVEAWDNKTNRDRTFQTIVWVKGSGNFVVGFFKDATVTKIC